MRIIKFLFKSILLIGCIGGVLFLLGREILLFMGVSRLKSSLSRIRSMTVQRTYIAQCKAKGATFDTEDNSAVLQLRFISDNEYVAEILCSQLTLDPIVVAQETLPQFVKKIPGGSGIVWGDDKSGVAIEIFNRRKTVFVQDQLIYTENNYDELGLGPATTCGGNGFSCCQIESEQGIGELFTGATDCPKSCYSQCISRPVILAFNTEPGLNLQTGTLNIDSGETVTFSYVVDAGNTNEVNIELDYGDGQKKTFFTDKQVNEHTYFCGKSECEYSVKITAENSRGITAFELPFMSFTISVKGI